MKRYFRMTVLFAFLAVAVLGPSARALGDDPPSIDALLDNPAMDELTAETLALNGSFNQSSYDQCPDPAHPGAIDHGDLNYDGQDQYLLADEYDPAGVVLGVHNFSAVVLVHDGGGWRGCKWDVSDLAYDLSDDPLHRPLSHRYLVYAIEYRLACDGNDPNLAGSPIIHLCNWPFKTTDPYSHIDAFANGPAIHDIEKAMEWVRAHANDHCDCWNGTVDLVGTSWGGNLTLMASYRLTTSYPYQPHAIASVSGGLEMQFQTNGFWPCYKNPSDPSDPNNQTIDAALCSRGNNGYLGCPFTPYPNSLCGYVPPSTYGWYADASPINKFGLGGPGAGWPVKVFYSNAGPPPKLPELQSYQSAVDFDTWLNTQQWQINTQRDFCTVNVDKLHGQGYLNNSSCTNDPNISVLRSMVNFIGA